MTRQDATELWGAEVVEHALAEPEPEPLSRELIRECQTRTQLPPGAFRAWTLSQPWPRFCAIVRIVSGVAREQLLDEDRDHDDR